MSPPTHSRHTTPQSISFTWIHLTTLPILVQFIVRNRLGHIDYICYALSQFNRFRLLHRLQGTHTATETIFNLQIDCNAKIECNNLSLFFYSISIRRVSFAWLRWNNKFMSQSEQTNYIHVQCAYGPWEVKVCPVIHSYLFSMFPLLFMKSINTWCETTCEYTRMEILGNNSGCPGLQLTIGVSARDYGVVVLFFGVKPIDLYETMRRCTSRQTCYPHCSCSWCNPTESNGAMCRAKWNKNEM